ncbi:RNA-binding protein [Agrilactobacillus fermenti]|uniref:YlmH family RNA-binding protein n=1 Tax=Agrilactobacillus fermenti TaxID=2586909 RepID=UPI003A5C0501
MDLDIYQHFRKDEIPFIDRMRELIGIVESEYRPVLTEFLDPRKVFIVHNLPAFEGLKIYEFGGFQHAEQRRLILAPDYYQPENKDYEIQPIEIQYPEKFATLKHGQILGTLANQSVDRQHFGDIITDGSHWQFFADAKMADYIITQITSIGRIKVRLEKIDFADVISAQVDWLEESLTASSLRVDTIVSDVFNISRQRAKQMIETKQVKVNWQVIEKPDFDVQMLDILSVRHFGRVQLLANQGETRKGKVRLSIRTLRK